MNISRFISIEQLELYYFSGTLPISISNPQNYFPDISHNRNNETDLVDYLLDGYRKQARPVKNVSHAVNVTVRLNLGKLVNLVSRNIKQV